MLGRRAGEKILETPEDVTGYLLDEVNIATVNGEGFGDDNHIRLSYALSDREIATAIERIGAAVQSLD